MHRPPSDLMWPELLSRTETLLASLNETYRAPSASRMVCSGILVPALFRVRCPDGCALCFLGAGSSVLHFPVLRNGHLVPEYCASAGRHNLTWRPKRKNRKSTSRRRIFDAGATLQDLRSGHPSAPPSDSPGKSHYEAGTPAPTRGRGRQRSGYIKRNIIKELCESAACRSERAAWTAEAMYVLTPGVRLTMKLRS